MTVGAFNVNDGSRDYNLSEWLIVDKKLINGNLTVSGKFPTDSSSLFMSVQSSLISFVGITTSDVVDMSYMFCGSNIQSIKLNDFDSTSTVNMCGMFQNARATVISVGDLRTDMVTDIGGMFMNTRVDTLDLVGFDLRMVVNSVNMLFGSSVTKFSQINRYAYDILLLNKPYTIISPTNTEWEIIGSGFSYPLDFFVTDGSTSWGFDEWQSLNKSTLTKGISINGNAPTNLTNLCAGVQQSIDLTNLITSDTVDMTRMFEGCGCENIDISKLDTSNVVSMEKMFHGATSMTIEFGGIDTSLVANMYGMFKDTTTPILNLENFNSSNVTNMASMFEGSVVTTLNLRGFDTSKVSTMTDIFKDSKVTTLSEVHGQTNNNLSNHKPSGLITPSNWDKINKNTRYPHITPFKVSDGIVGYTMDEWIALDKETITNDLIVSGEFPIGGEWMFDGVKSESISFADITDIESIPKLDCIQHTPISNDNIYQDVSTGMWFVGDLMGDETREISNGSSLQFNRSNVAVTTSSYMDMNVPQAIEVHMKSTAPTQTAYLVFQGIHPQLLDFAILLESGRFTVKALGAVS